MKIKIKEWFSSIDFAQKLKNHRRVLILLVIFLILFAGLPSIIPLPEIKYHSGKDTNPVFGEFLDVNGISTFVQELGEKTNPVVVFIHGFGGSTFTWRKNLKPVADSGFRVIAIDLKGFGLTDKILDTNYSHQAQSDFVYSVLEFLGITKASFVAHSMGGNVVLNIANRYPAIVDKIVLAGTPINNTQIFNSSFFVNFYFTKQILRQVITRIITPDRVKDFFRGAYFNPEVLTDTELESYVLPLQVKDWDLALLGNIRDSYLNTLNFDLQSITNKTLIIWGKNDNIVNTSEGMELNQILPSSILKIIRDCGHLPMEEKPDSFNSLVISFLKPQQ